jgi:hypothetical protein
VKRIIAGLCAVCVAMMFAGCTVVVQNDTQVKAHNALTDLSVEVDGQPNNVASIDLENVGIGDDVVFSEILGGTTSIAKTTKESGPVIISFGSAWANVETVVLGTTHLNPVQITNISTMTTSIVAGTTNTVEFNETTAGVIFSALAKKKTK